jgi:hypothetical protein
MSQYDDIVGPRGPSILERLYPHIAGVDCPLAADAVDDYLITGRPVAVPLSLGAGRYNITANWRGIARQPLINHVRSLGPNHHVVVRGTRSAATLQQLNGQGNHVTATHFFIVANVGGQVYVIDAMTRQVTTDVGGYLTGQGMDRLAYASSYEAEEIIVP